MILTCIRSDAEFEESYAVSYCTDCRDHFLGVRKEVHKKQNPAPGVHATGKFTDDPGPQSFHDPVSNQNLCGLCGSNQLDMGYGFAGGRGLGSYTFCLECHCCLDFSEDKE